MQPSACPPSARRRRALATALLLVLSPMATAAGNDTAGFGFNYWPQDYRGCTELTDAAWPAARRAISADLDLMKSLGADVLRLSLYMETSGYAPGNTPVPGQCKHLPEFLDLAEAAGLKTIIAFSNTYLQWDGVNQRYKWQAPEYGYTAFPPGEDYWQFMTHSKAWINQMVELSTGHGDILYYDIQNEYDSTIDSIDYYFRTMYSESDIPQGKRGISILNTPHDIKPASENWKSVPSQLAVLKGSLAYVDFHSYPHVPKENCPLHWDIETTYDNMQSAFPGSIVVLGEFGRRAIGQQDPEPDEGPYPWPECTPPNTPQQRSWDEPSQTAAELDLIARSATKAIPYYLHWMLWDNTPKPVSPPQERAELQVYGYGYSPHAPKDVIGALAELRGKVANADFEHAAQVGQLPQSWDAGSWGPANSGPAVSLFTSGGAGTGEAATRAHYARLQAQQACASCVIWMQADAFEIGAGKRVHFNAYVRSNLDDVQLKLVQYDADWNVLAVSSAPSFTPSGWSWNNYAVRFREQNPALPAGSWSVTTAPGTVRAILTIGGTPARAPARLDVDAVSVAVD